MRIIFGADHGGVELKDLLVKRLSENGYEVEDLGTHGTDSVDYPDFAKRTAEAVAADKDAKGILVCGTGIGMSIAANKVKGIYCAKVNNAEEGRLAAEHNHANMLALGGRITGPDLAYAAVKAWLKASHGGDRHQRRVDKIISMES
ncbi:ribose 5-phosphate isomerase B [bacterium]|nr:ribose 5-phosphate isomerase B [bacterium]